MEWPPAEAAEEASGEGLDGSMLVGDVGVVVAAAAVVGPLDGARATVGVLVVVECDGGAAAAGLGPVKDGVHCRRGSRRLSDTRCQLCDHPQYDG